MQDYIKCYGCNTKIQVGTFVKHSTGFDLDGEIIERHCQT